MKYIIIRNNKDFFKKNNLKKFKICKATLFKQKPFKNLNLFLKIFINKN